MPKLHLNPDIFFMLKDKDIILWDYKNRQQFSLTPPYFERLVAHSRGDIKDNLLSTLTNIFLKKVYY
jgi:hypothetical protein